jgi:hypothetical protein
MQQPVLPSQLIRLALKAEVNDVVNKFSTKKSKNKDASFLHQLFFERFSEKVPATKKNPGNLPEDPNEFSSYE